MSGCSVDGQTARRRCSATTATPVAEVEVEPPHAAISTLCWPRSRPCVASCSGAGSWLDALEDERRGVPACSRAVSGCRSVRECPCGYASRHRPPGHHSSDLTAAELEHGWYVNLAEVSLGRCGSGRDEELQMSPTCPYLEATMAVLLSSSWPTVPPAT